MDNQVSTVMRGFLALAPAQQNEYIAALSEYVQGGPLTQDRIRRESTRNWGPITKVDLGPTTTHTCTCCGR